MSATNDAPERSFLPAMAGLFWTSCPDIAFTMSDTITRIFWRRSGRSSTGRVLPCCRATFPSWRENLRSDSASVPAAASRKYFFAAQEVKGSKRRSNSHAPARAAMACFTRTALFTA